MSHLNEPPSRSQQLSPQSPPQTLPRAQRINYKASYEKQKNEHEKDKRLIDQLRTELERASAANARLEEQVKGLENQNRKMVKKRIDQDDEACTSFVPLSFETILNFLAM